MTHLLRPFSSVTRWLGNLVGLFLLDTSQSFRSGRWFGRSPLSVFPGRLIYFSAKRTNIITADKSRVSSVRRAYDFAFIPQFSRIWPRYEFSITDRIPFPTSVVRNTATVLSSAAQFVARFLLAKPTVKSKESHEQFGNFFFKLLSVPYSVRTVSGLSFR